MKHALVKAALGLSLLTCFAPSALAADRAEAQSAPARTAGASADVLARAAQAHPSCVLMQFTDDTRFKKLDSGERLAELVMSKIAAGQKFNLKVSKPIAADMEAMLYDDRRAEVEAAKSAIEGGDLSAVFEGPAFRDESAQTITTAQKGQFLAPAVTAKIGKDADADYLLQGTVVMLGRGTFEDANFQTAMAIGQVALDYIPGLGMFGGLLKNVLQNSNKVDSGFSVMADMRVINAATGEVVWTDRVSEHAGKSKIDYALGHSGNTQLSESDYVKALDKAAAHLVKDMEAALADRTLFRL